jgi:hypothetical protein
MTIDFEMDVSTAPSTTTDLTTIVNSPKSMTNDEGTVTERDIKEVIEAVNFTTANTAAQNKAPWGMRIARTIRGGTT